jgi:hypothetical protein
MRGPLAPAGHLAAKDWEKSIAINLRATAGLIEAFGPLLGAEGRAVFFEDPRGGEKFFGHYGVDQGGADRARAVLGRGRGADRAAGAGPEPAPHGDGDAGAVLSRGRIARGSPARRRRRNGCWRRSWRPEGAACGGAGAPLSGRACASSSPTTTGSTPRASRSCTASRSRSRAARARSGPWPRPSSSRGWRTASATPTRR